MADGHPAPGAAHAHLRAETRALHAAVEAHLRPGALAERAAYARFLLMNLPCAPIELGLATAGVRRLLPDWDRRERRAALAADLDELGVQPPTLSTPAIAEDAGTLFGWSYVLEGSRLGARVILRTVATSQDPAVRTATRFLRHGGGEDFWRSFTACLSRIDRDADATTRAGIAARAAFESFLAAATAAQQPGACEPVAR